MTVYALVPMWQHSSVVVIHDFVPKTEISNLKYNGSISFQFSNREKILTVTGVESYTCCVVFPNEQRQFITNGIFIMRIPSVYPVTRIELWEVQQRGELFSSQVKIPDAVLFFQPQ